VQRSVYAFTDYDSWKGCTDFSTDTAKQ